MSVSLGVTISAMVLFFGVVGFPGTQGLIGAGIASVVLVLVGIYLKLSIIVSRLSSAK